MMMNNGILSQQEIDALLAGGNKQADQKAVELLTEIERDTLGEIGNISMGTAATVLSTLLRRKVAITTPEVRVINREQLRSDFPLPYVIVEVQYRQGLHGANIFVVKTEDAGMIADLMMGMEPQAGRSNLSEIELSAVGEAMNQMMGSATTSLSTVFNTRIDISPPMLTIVNLGEATLSLPSMFEELVAIKFQMSIENLLDSEIMQIVPIEAVKNMMEMLTGDNSGSDSMAMDTPLPQPGISDNNAQSEAKVTHDRMTSENLSNPESSVSQPPPPQPTPASLTIQPVQFASLHEFPVNPIPQNIGLILDVPLDVSVELGKTRKTIKEVLELQQGSIIQLDKMAGEPVDLIVNGKLIARGEVVVIDENYGIRITAIISPMDRVNKLQ